MLERVATKFEFNTAQCGDALELLQSLPGSGAAAVIFDPQHRSVLNAMAYGNEGTKQVARCQLPQMSDQYIDLCCEEITRVLRPSGHLLLWSDTFRLCEGYHLRCKKTLPTVDLISWDDLNPKGGNGYRSRRCGAFLLVLQKPPKRARATWSDHRIRDKWSESVDRKIHVHRKPTELTSRLIAAVTNPGDLVIDPAAGSFLILEICQLLGRRFIGVDIAWASEEAEP
jgi:site-specific DNA-methyltransferase (adenine-specific)